METEKQFQTIHPPVPIGTRVLSPKDLAAHFTMIQRALLRFQKDLVRWFRDYQGVAYSPRWGSWSPWIKDLVKSRQEALLKDFTFVAPWLHFAFEGTTRTWAAYALFRFIAAKAGEAALNAVLRENYAGPSRVAVPEPPKDLVVPVPTPIRVPSAANTITINHPDVVPSITGVNVEDATPVLNAANGVGL